LLDWASESIRREPWLNRVKWARYIYLSN
jgi:hypothetical protein